MLYEDLYSQFVDAVNEGDIASANTALMKELGNILVRNRQDFIDLLNESGIPATAYMSDLDLVDLFADNIPKNKQLVLGASLLVNMHNKQMGFDGEEEISDEGVKAGYEVMCSYFDDYSNGEGEGYIPGIATAKGAASGGEVGAIAGAVSDIAKMTTQLNQSRSKKRFGVTDTLAKQKEAKAAITQQILANRQAQAEAASKQAVQKAKNKRILLIVGSVVGGLAVLGLGWYLISKKR